MTRPASSATHTRSEACSTSAASRISDASTRCSAAFSSDRSRATMEIASIWFSSFRWATKSVEIGRILFCEVDNRNSPLQVPLDLTVGRATVAY
ncbi:MAG: Uncharacterised protein [Acidimicrobiaceae bacterium]|nr:MAG: Uncharacterised protein [Acidimicrobiaceae bacterium]